MRQFSLLILQVTSVQMWWVFPPKNLEKMHAPFFLKIFLREILLSLSTIALNKSYQILLAVSFVIFIISNKSNSMYNSSFLLQKVFIKLKIF